VVTVSSAPPAPGLYLGKVRHRRFQPRAHAFTYPVFMAFLDIDRLPELMAVSDLTGLNAFAWASFDDRDHLGHSSLPLRERLRLDAAAQGVALPAGPLFLLTNLRYAGYCFNPVNYYYCYDTAGRLARICADVRNTPWGERHSYWMDPEQGVETAQGRSFEVDKTFHVSPFMPMDCRYRWAFTEPGEDLRVHISEFHRQDDNSLEFFFDVDLTLHRHPWDAGNLRDTLLRFPLMTLQVIFAIHWEALRLWIKRVPVFTHPSKAGVRQG